MFETYVIYRVFLLSCVLNFREIFQYKRQFVYTGYFKIIPKMSSLRKSLYEQGFANMYFVFEIQGGQGLRRELGFGNLIILSLHT